MKAATAYLQWGPLLDCESLSSSVGGIFNMIRYRAPGTSGGLLLASVRSPSTLLHLADESRPTVVVTCSRLTIRIGLAMSVQEFHITDASTIRLYGARST